MKSLPLWTKTLAVVSLTAFGAVACDDGGQTQRTAETGTQQEQDEGLYTTQGQQDNEVDIPRDSGITAEENRRQSQDESVSQQQGSELYGDTGTEQGTQQGTQSDQEILEETTELQETDDDRVAQGN